MTIQEIESACDASQLLDFSRHELEAPELSLKRMFYPLGFPTEVRTNSAEVFDLMAELWGKFEKQHDTEPIRTDVHVVESDSTECPPAPVFRIMMPLLVAVADADNYSIVDVVQSRTQITISHSTLRHRLYAKYFLLGTPGCCISTRYTTPLHAGCVALDGRGVLLCGDSGAGKSSLSYACARAGWTYVCRRWKLFAEWRRQADGNGGLLPGSLSAHSGGAFSRGERAGDHAACGGQTVDRDCQRRPCLIWSVHRQRTWTLWFFSIGMPEGRRSLCPIARTWRDITCGRSHLEHRRRSPRSIERSSGFLTVDVFELRYTDLDWAVDRLRTLVREGR